MKYAIVESGGKQYTAAEEKSIVVDHLNVEVGQEVVFDQVLLLVDDEKVAVGSPVVTGAKVKATVVDQFKGPKIIIFKYRPKKHYRVKTGHRQQYTRLMIEKIEVE